ncbi:3-hydroxybutyryl-CoA dehydrogenase [Oceanobacillus profundus]|uniref:3-hydroxybutyryl-CoA dehydrogenase n=1 Tax=Oceanobacillus profundus TaxID=372463 RepID=A0A417YNR6_9BACI|nr:3-hydroxybutyryl-CoA dehydrogenase [Oceanobacillus profundus]MBR3118183.1 3-hydroxybutyryl-CoA dehydrogenase [Oceanobacillus sp.]PAE30571.1 3-hydroxybutyryl-CoA dehydrogenase [Paenibacillus sp. 7884-2]MCM3398822.1 3-hydroxybutyryl-CoA dehydrogenase [Oceanobacillus profundus]MDO6450101.1 3-hydroxybutyryl-CoA dehydrogenase [Oceanobacillus profundus]RHW35425.1 3-hydroxybutyryl-CoA dehydrogenase [Oceanobacillus profundus]
MAINNVMVIGAGQMGAGIAQVCAQSGFNVLLHDRDKNALQAGINGIEKLLARNVEKKRLTKEEKATTLGRLTPSHTLEDAATCDLIIEAVVENMDVKSAVFKEVDTHAPKHAILASNTSSLPITEIAAETKRPDQVIGMHFMNPVPVMKLVEIIRGLQTSDETYETIQMMTVQLSKTPVEVKDFPGFVSNRILMPMINEAIYTVYEGVATPKDVDQVMKLGMNHPMGPLTLADFIGLDTCLYIMEVLHEGFGDSKYRPCPLLRQYVKAGWLGKKSGKGFYEYS